MALLDDSIKNQLKEYFKNISSEISFVVKYGADDKAKNLKDFLEEVASLSDKISVKENAELDYRPNTFEIYKEGKATKMIFSGIPGGHEFNSFILAILSMFGLGKKLSDEQKAKLENIKEFKKVEVFVTLSCSLCPEVVQGLNLIALNCENVSSNMIDGSFYIDEMNEKKITVSPTIYVNGTFVESGAQTLDKLIDLLNK